LLRYYIRLDDAHDRMNLSKWNKIIKLLDKYDIKAIIGVIPENKDKAIVYNNKIENFWEIIKHWQNNSHIIGIHGLNHLKITNNSGLVPKNNKSEFAGLTLDEQIIKLKKSKRIFDLNKINVKIFIPPFHSFDYNTLKALKYININVLYDGISFYPYKERGIILVPQQYNYFKKRKKGVWSICLHPSDISNNELLKLEKFIQDNRKNFKNDFFETIFKFNRNRNLIDRMFFYWFFIRRKIYFFKKNMLKVINDRN